MIADSLMIFSVYIFSSFSVQYSIMMLMKEFSYPEITKRTMFIHIYVCHFDLCDVEVD